MTIYAMTYDWIANELYVAVSDGNLKAIRISVHTMSMINDAVLLYEHMPTDTELTINPFTRYTSNINSCIII